MPSRPDGKSLTHRALAGLFWMSSGSGAQAIVQIVVLVVLARLLEPSDFGLVGAALLVAGISTVFSELGIGPAIVQRPVLEERHVRLGFTLSLGLGATMAIMVSLGAPAIAGFLRMPDLVPILRVMSIVFVLDGAAVVAESLLQRDLRFRALTATHLASYGLGYAATGITFAFLGFGVWSLVVANLGMRATRATIFVLLQPHPKAFIADREAFRELMYYGTGHTVARMGNYTAFNGDNLVVGRWLGVDALGVYGRAFQLVAAPTSMFGQVLSRVLFPTMAKVQTDREKLRRAYRRSVALTALLILPTSIVLVVLAPEIVRVLLGPGWSATILPFQILALSMLLRTSYKVSDTVARATGAVYRRAWRQWVYAALVVAGAYVGQQWGLAGISIGVLVAVCANFLLMTGLSLKLTQLSWRTFLGAHAPALLLAAPVGYGTLRLTQFARDAGLPSTLVLAVAALVPFAALVMLLTLRPRILLGDDGRWMIDTLMRYVQPRGTGSEPLDVAQRKA